MRDYVFEPTSHYGVVDNEFGRRRILVGCGNCGERVIAYAWSLAGSGKKCPGCGSIIHERRTEVRPRKTVVDASQTDQQPKPERDAQ